MGQIVPFPPSEGMKVASLSSDFRVEQEMKKK